MRASRLLEASNARNIYEDGVRAGIDPGLAEIAANRFTTRIFPIDTAHPRRFRLHFVAAIDEPNDERVTYPNKLGSAGGPMTAPAVASGSTLSVLLDSRAAIRSDKLPCSRPNV